ncbi:MAG TPA: hypothetical protein VGQ62_00220 [Chloroflexota bacterium]|jgi:hypothetical protein|nr:hypothetical protein [Chloroflexota bacterium]
MSMSVQPDVVRFGGDQLPVGVHGIDSPIAQQIRDVAAHSLFSLIGEPAPQHPQLVHEATRLLRRYLSWLDAGEVLATEGFHAPDADRVSANVMVLGEVEQLAAEWSTTGVLHAWGHFIAPPAAHGEAVAAAIAADGIARLYMASAWTRAA